MADSQDSCNKSSVIWLTRPNRNIQGSQRVTALSSINLKRCMKFGDVKNVCLYVLKGPLKTEFLMFLQKTDDPEKVLGSRVSSLSKSRDFSSGSPRLMRRPSLVGPSVAVGITTMSASDVSESCLFVSIPNPEMGWNRT
jgi:hypothetical protein